MGVTCEGRHNANSSQAVVEQLHFVTGVTNLKILQLPKKVRKKIILHKMSKIINKAWN